MSRLSPLVAVMLTCLISVSSAQERPYTEGPVVSVSYIRIKPGMFDKYMTYLDTEYKRTMEAQKKEGICSGQPARPGAADRAADN